MNPGDVVEVDIEGVGLLRIQSPPQALKSQNPIE